MREVLSPIEPVSVDTPLGRINVRPVSAQGVQVDAPHLTVNGVPLKASAFLNASSNTRQFDIVRNYRLSVERRNARARAGDRRA
jgi:hypothetical protein